MLPTQDPKVIEDIFQRLFGELFTDESLMQNLQGINRVVLIKYERPDVSIYLDLKDSGSNVVFQADGIQEPAAVLEMDWETAHKLWSGNLDLIPAMMSERVRVAGEVEQFVQLRSMYGKATELYKDIISDIGEA
jgi:putative sterol carrier protein